MKEKIKRWGAHEVTKGQFKGGLHVATKSYWNFHKDLTILNLHLEHSATSLNPEEGTMRNILLAVTSILEFELEFLIERHIDAAASKKDIRLARRMRTHFVTFFEKYKWLYDHGIINTNEFNVLDQITKLRNKFTHFKPTVRRIKELYFGHPAMTSHSVRNLMCDAQYLLVDLNKRFGLKKRWRIIPAGFAEESNWSSHIYAGKKRTHRYA